MPLPRAEIVLKNVSGPSLAPGYQGEYVVLPANDRSGGNPHLFKAGEWISIAATAKTIEALRTPVADGLVTVEEDEFGRYLAAGPIAAFEPEFNTVVSGTLTFPHWVLHDPTVDPLVTVDFEISSDGGATWNGIVTVPEPPAQVTPALHRPDTLDTVTWDSTAVANGTYHLRMIVTVPAGSPDIVGPFRVEN